MQVGLLTFAFPGPLRCLALRGRGHVENASSSLAHRPTGDFLESRRYVAVVRFIKDVLGDLEVLAQRCFSWRCWEVVHGGAGVEKGDRTTSSRPMPWPLLSGYLYTRVSGLIAASEKVVSVSFIGSVSNPYPAPRPCLTCDFCLVLGAQRYTTDSWSDCP